MVGSASDLKLPKPERVNGGVAFYIIGFAFFMNIYILSLRLHSYNMEESGCRGLKQLSAYDLYQESGKECIIRGQIRLRQSG